MKPVRLLCCSKVFQRVASLKLFRKFLEKPSHMHIFYQQSQPGISKLTTFFRVDSTLNFYSFSGSPIKVDRYRMKLVILIKNN